MMALRFMYAQVAALLAVTLISGCVQYPVSTQSVVDHRPVLSFRLDPSDIARLADARVLVDGLDSGRLGDLVEGSGALRVLPGTHVIRVVNGVTVVFEERAYLGDGVARPFLIK